MYNEMIFAGFGGQGIMTIGQLVAYAGMGEGNAVAWIPSYGPEMRGGTANCTVVVTDEGQVGAPLTAHPDWVIAMNNPAFAKFEPMIETGGLMIYNESLITHKPSRKDITYLPVKANDLAEGIGNARLASIVCVAALIGYTDVIKKVESIEKALKSVIPERHHKLIPQNMEAVKLGMEIGKKAKGNGKG